MKKGILVVAILLIVGFGIVQSRSGNDCEVRIAMNMAGSEWSIFKEQIFPSFEKEFGCRVAGQEVNADSVIKMLQVNKSSNKTAPFHVLAQDNMKLFPLVAEGLVQDIGNEFSTLAKNPKFVSALVDGGKFEGVQYFVPFRPNVQIIYFNSEKLAALGLTPPKDWKELKELAKTIYEKEKSPKILLKASGGAPTATQLYEFIISGGGDPFDFSNEGTQATFTYLRELWPYVSKDSLKAKWDTSNEYIAREAVYLMQNWPFGFKIIREEYKKDAVNVYGGIAGKQRAHVIGGDMMGIPVGVDPKMRPMAIKLIRYLQRKEIQQLFVQNLGWPSIRTDSYDNIEDELIKEQFVAVNDAMKHGIFRKNVPYWNDYQRMVNEVFDLVVVKQQQDYQSVFAKYANELKAIQEQHQL